METPSAAPRPNVRLHEREVAGRISVQTLMGRIRIQAQDKVFDLPKGYLLAFDRGVTHDVEALQDSALWLTIGWPEDIKKRQLGCFAYLVQKYSSDRSVEESVDQIPIRDGRNDGAQYRNQSR